MYICGGNDASNNRLNDLWSYDPATDTWAQLTSGPFLGRTYHTAVPIDGKMYIFGGWSIYNTDLKDLWSYDTSTDTWEQLTSGDIKRNNHTAAVIDGKMYVFGGWGGSSYLNDLWSYDPATDTWAQLTSGATARSKHTAAVIDGKMYVFGGWDSSSYFNDLWSYDPATDTWAQLTSSGAIERIYHTAVPIGGKMCIFGGWDASNNRLNDLWSYDPATDTWAQLTSGATARSFHAAASLPVPDGDSYEWKLVATNDSDIRSPNDPDLFDPTIIDPALAYTCGDLVNGPYSILNAGELTFYQWFSGALRAVKSLKQVDTNTMQSGVWHTIDGYWANPPTIAVWPVDNLTYHYSYSAQSQKLRIGLTDIEEVSDGVYRIKGDSFLESQAGSTIVYPALSCSGSTSAQTSNYTLPANARKITANLRFLGYCGVWFDGDYHRCQIQIRAKIVYYTGGAWVSSPWTPTYTVGQSYAATTVSTPTTAADIVYAYLYIERTATTSSIIGVGNGADGVSGILDNLTCSLAGGAVITTGELGYIPIGE
jgi:hypothetical protein